MAPLSKKNKFDDSLKKLKCYNRNLTRYFDSVWNVILKIFSQIWKIFKNKIVVAVNGNRNILFCLKYIQKKSSYNNLIDALLLTKKYLKLSPFKPFSMCYSLRDLNTNTIKMYQTIYTNRHFIFITISFPFSSSSDLQSPEGTRCPPSLSEYYCDKHVHRVPPGDLGTPPA